MQTKGKKKPKTSHNWDNGDGIVHLEKHGQIEIFILFGVFQYPQTNAEVMKQTPKNSVKSGYHEPCKSIF